MIRFLKNFFNSPIYLYVNKTIMELSFGRLRNIYLSAKKRNSETPVTLPENFAAGIKRTVGSLTTICVEVGNKTNQEILIKKESSGEIQTDVLSYVNELVQAELDTLGIAVELPTMEELRES